MTVTLERSTPRWLSTLVMIGLVGIVAAVLAWMTSERRSGAGAGAPEEAASSPAAAAAGQGPGRPADAKIHVPLFVEPARVRPTPRFRFTFDPPEALAAFRLEEKLDAVVAGAAHDLERAALLMHWARAQWEPGIPNPYPPLDARIILRDIRRGFTGGFCAQYDYVLAQALQSFGIPARYVSLVEHEVIEARLPDQGRWVCLDPLNDAWYADETGRALSVLEIHRRVLAGEKVTPSAGSRIPDLDKVLPAFRSFAVWLKNDHVSSPLNFADLEAYKVYFLDEPAAAGKVPAGLLTTTRPEDLYPG